MSQDSKMSHIHFEIPERLKAAYVKQAARDGGNKKLVDWILRTLEKGLDDDLKGSNGGKNEQS